MGFSAKFAEKKFYFFCFYTMAMAQEKEKLSAVEIKLIDDITRLLSEKNRSKAWLADEIGVSYDTLRRFLNGAQTLPVTKADRMLCALGSNLPNVFIIPILEAMKENMCQQIDEQIDAFMSSSLNE